MTTQGSLVRDIDFNNIQKQLARLLGDTVGDYPSDPAAGTYGYGQSILSGTVIRVTNEVEATQFAKLRSDIIKIATHCGFLGNTVVTSLPVINKGDILYADHLNKFQDCLTFLTTNRFALGAGQYSDELLNANLNNSRLIPWGNSANPVYKRSIYGGEQVKHQFTLDFGTAEAARYFFNAGSSVRISASRTGGRNTVQNTNWTNLLNNIGTVVFNYNSCYGDGGTGKPIGFYQLTRNPVLVFSSSGTAAYTGNTYSIYASCDVNNNQNGGAKVITMTIYFDDAHVQHWPHAYHADWVDGTLTSNVSIRRATSPTGTGVTVSPPVARNIILLSDNQ